ncbi:asparagine synthase-related protein [Clostridium botulinum]|uniref:asparagine synthase-related protein n=1 Tax=Clostridium botulinum TaxID=1491 RepID=UPI002492E995|nr:asparagine synthase-related protein [Clostridium botulinum]BDB02544.1 asparagine synthase [Clostridium botulinum]
MSILVIEKNNDILNSLTENIKYYYEESSLNGTNIKFLNDEILYKLDKSSINNKNKMIEVFVLGEIYINFKDNTSLKDIIFLYEEFGEELFKSLNGRFILCLIDRNKDIIYIVNDRYGIINCYYRMDENGFIITNKAEVMIDNITTRVIDEEAVNDYIKYGCLKNNRTLLKNVKRLQSASIVKITKEDIKIQQYWDWNIKKKENISFNESVEKLGGLWIEAVRRTLNKYEKFNITVTGGLDSRAIVAAIDYLGLNHKINLSYTIGIKGCLEEKIARQIAERAGLKYKFFEIDNNKYLQNCERALKRSICVLNANFACINILDSEEIYKYPILSGTFGGESVGGDLLINNANYNSKDEIYDYINNLQAKVYGVNDSILLKKNSVLNKNCFDKNLQKYSHFDFYIFNEYLIKNRTAVLYEMMGDNYKCITPFLDNDFFNYLYSLPEEWRKNHYIYNMMLLKFFPKFYLDIPWERTNLPIIVELEEKYIEKYSSSVVENLNIKNKDVVLFGASTLGEKAYKFLKEGYNILAFCDNDYKKWDTEFCGIKVISPKELVNMRKISVVIASMYYDEMLKQLKILNIKDVTVFGYKDRNDTSTDFNKWIKDYNVYSPIKNEISKSQYINEYMNVNYLMENFDKYIDSKEGVKTVMLTNSLNHVLKNIMKK